MKLIAYNVRDDEIPFIQKWSVENNIEVKYTPTTLNLDTIDAAQGYDGISCLQTIPYSAELFAKMHELGIHFLALRNVGTDNVDLAAAKSNDVRITNVPDYSPQSIAEFAVTTSLFLNRKIGYMQRQLADRGEFHFSADFMGTLMSEQTVGIIGTGKIGKWAYKLFESLGAKVIAYDKFPDIESPLDIDYVSDINEIYKNSDIVDLHMPGLKDNHHMINPQVFAMMKDTALLINTARGSIVDTKALIFALEHHQIGGAGIDTIENESADLQDSRSIKKITDPDVLRLAAMPNVLITPHSAFHTTESVTNMVNISLNNLVDMGTGKVSKDEV